MEGLQWKGGPSGKGVFNRELLNAQWDDVYSCRSVNTAFAQFKSILSNTLDRHDPVVQKTVKGKPSRWLTEEVKRHMNIRDQLSRKAQKYGRPVDWQNF